MNIKEVNTANPEQYIMVTRQFGKPIYIGLLADGEIVAVETPAEAEKWSHADTLSAAKLGYHRAATGYDGLVFEMA